VSCLKWKTKGASAIWFGWQPLVVCRNFRNNVIFKGVILDASSLLEEIKLSSWVWFTSRYGRKTCIHFSSWCLDPFTYIQSNWLCAFHRKGLRISCTPL
jgi:hypothetical protein